VQDRHDASTGLLERQPIYDELVAENERLRKRLGQDEARMAKMERLLAEARQGATRPSSQFPMGMRKEGGFQGRHPEQAPGTRGAVGSQVWSWATAWGALHHGLVLSVGICWQMLSRVGLWVSARATSTSSASTGTDLVPTHRAGIVSRPPTPPLPACHPEPLRNDDRYFGEDSPFSNVERGACRDRRNPRLQQTSIARQRGNRRRRPSPRVLRNRRILAAAVTVLVVAVVVPRAHRFMPGNPVQLIVAERGAPGQVSPPPRTEMTSTTSSTLPSIAPATPGPSRVIGFGSKQSGAVALTFDDGYCDDCVGGLVAGAERTGAHITLCPNGMYGERAWNGHAARIKVLLSKGQVAICNHTWGHKDLTELDAEQVRAELTRNEDWIQATFGVTSRPFFRPPYGIHNAAVDRVAAELGYTRVLMWSGSLGDSYTQAPDDILGSMREFAAPGRVILAHGNRQVTADLFDELVRIARGAGLRTVTVAEMFPDAR